MSRYIAEYYVSLGCDMYVLNRNSREQSVGVKLIEADRHVPGVNKYWGKYGTDKIATERYLCQAVPCAYILRPPYLYGPMNNIYREAFVFDCAMNKRLFYLPHNTAVRGHSRKL